MVQAASIPLTIRVTASQVPAAARVFVAGNQPSLGAWRPNGVALNRQDDGSWGHTVLVDSALPVELKVTRGSWETEALGADGAVPPHLRLDIAAPRTVHVHVAQWKDEVFMPPGGQTDTLAWHRQLVGDGLKPRDVVVWLPPGYDTDLTRRYPVLYLYTTGKTASIRRLRRSGTRGRSTPRRPGSSALG